MPISLPVMAQNLQTGLAAAQAGEYAITLKEWKPLAEAGDSVAQYNLGQMYRTGDGVIEDYAEALNWYRLAAEQGCAKSQTNLGSMYHKGHGVIQNYSIAHMWYNIGAANGDKPGGTLRDSLAKTMSSSRISNAQAKARVCMSSDYKKCEY
tara:strand:- start:1116 stop:1568 length:453 start_codon:yes stop_codon:yes gene_type:complete